MDELGEGEGLHGLVNEVGSRNHEHEHEEHFHKDLGPGKRWAPGDGLHGVEVGEGGGLRESHS